MIVDYEILKRSGCTTERLKEIFTATPFTELEDVTEEQKLKREKDIEIRERFEKEISSKLMDHINFSLKNFDFYGAVDLAWDSDAINKSTYPLMLYAQGKIDAGACASMCDGTPCSKYATKNSDNTITIDLPKLFEATVNLIRSIIGRRLAAQSNKYSNLWPHYKFESRSSSLVGKLMADIISQICDMISDNYNYKHHEVQVMRDMMLYAHSVDFVRSSWEREETWVQKEIPEELRVDGEKIKLQVEIGKEGVAFVNPHPTRVFWDHSYPLADLNTDTGPEYVGFWDVSKYGDVKSNPKYWNRDKITFSSGMVGLFTTYRQYFSQYYCAITPPCSGFDYAAPGSNDRLNNVGYYSSDMDSSAVVSANFYKKIIPSDYGIGDYPFPIWMRLVVAGDKTVNFSEFMPSTPAAVASYNENDSRLVNVSLAHELMGYQDHLTNLLSYLLLCLKADNIKVLVVDTDSAKPEHIKAFRKTLTGTNYYSETVVLEVSGAKLRELGIDPGKVIQLVETRSTAITIIFQAISQLLSLTERMVALSPQEQGQPAPREISATETNLIAGTTESVYGFISDSIDEYRAAKKRIIYESYMAKGNQNFRVPVENRYTRKTIEAAGFEVVQDESESYANINDPSIPARHTVTGSKKKLCYDYIFTSRDGAERSANSQAANVLVQLFGLILNSPVATAIPKEKIFELINEIFRLSGAGIDLKLELQEGDQNSLGPDPQKQVEAALQQVVGQLEAQGQDTQAIQGILEQLTGHTEKNSQEIDALKQAQFNAQQMGAPTSGVPEPMIMGM